MLHLLGVTVGTAEYAKIVEWPAIRTAQKGMSRATDSADAANLPGVINAVAKTLYVVADSADIVQRCTVRPAQTGVLPIIRVHRIPCHLTAIVHTVSPGFIGCGAVKG